MVRRLFVRRYKEFENGANNDPADRVMFGFTCLMDFFSYVEKHLQDGA